MKKIVFIVLGLILSIFIFTSCQRTCKVAGCSQPTFENGYCSQHYYIEQAKGAIGALGNIINDSINKK